MTRFISIFLPCMLSLSTPVMAEDSGADSTEMRLPGHRAVYELSLTSGRGTQTISSAEGRYAFDLEDVCEGYTLNERLVVRLVRDGGTILTDYRLSAFETESGDLYRFSTETEFNGATGQSASGDLSVDDESAELRYEDSEDVSFDEEVLPPVAHIRAIIEAAMAGEERYAATVFDGDIDKPIFYAVTRIAEASGDVDTSSIDGAEHIDGQKRWAVDSVYFPPASAGDIESSIPEFRFTATLYENGVVTDLVLGYRACDPPLSHRAACRIRESPAYPPNANRDCATGFRTLLRTRLRPESGSLPRTLFVILSPPILVERYFGATLA